MPKIFHAIAIAAATGAGSLVLSASPSLACYATATPCWEAPDPGAKAQAPVAHPRGLYNFAPGGSTTNSPRPSAPHRALQRGPALSTSK
jgi:hypothetical protein